MQLKLLRIILLLVFVIGASFQIQAQLRNSCPSYIGEIELYVPRSYLGFENAPAKIDMIAMPWGNDEGKLIFEVGLVNSSNKTIKALKFHWYLFNINTYKNTQAEDFPTFLEKITLLQNDFPIDLTSEFKPKDSLEVSIKIPCDDITEKIGISARGSDLVLEPVVTEISYGDGSTWKRKQ